MTDNYIQLTGKLKLSNGEDLPEQGKKWSITNPATGKSMTLVTGCKRHPVDYFSYAVIVTDKIVDNVSCTKELYYAASDGKFDFWPLRCYDGEDVSAARLEYWEKKVEEEEKSLRLNRKLALLDTAWPALPDDLKLMVKNFDHYFEMSDDGGVYRAGVMSQAVIMKRLNDLNAVAYFKGYQTLVYSWNNDHVSAEERRVLADIADRLKIKLPTELVENSQQQAEVYFELYWKHMPQLVVEK